MSGGLDLSEVKYDAQEHTDLVATILAESHLKPHNIFRHAKFKNKKVVDIGCGDGALSRESINKGAKYVLGIDAKPDMIKIANSLNLGYEKNIQYEQVFIEDITGKENFDIAILSYLLNNAKSFNQILKQLENTASFLKPGGIAIVYNNNPFDKKGGDFRKYGFTKTLTGLKEGDKIIYDYSPAITEPIINYYINHEMHVKAFKDAGFSQFAWEPITLYHNADMQFWEDYFNHEQLPVIGMVAKKYNPDEY